MKSKIKACDTCKWGRKIPGDAGWWECSFKLELPICFRSRSVVRYDVFVDEATIISCPRWKAKKSKKGRK